MGKLRIAVLGAGNIGGTLGRKWIAAGHTVAFGVSNPSGAKAQALRSELDNKVSIGSIDDALASGNIDVVVFAVPGTAMDEIIAAHAAQLDGKIIVDTANRMGGGPMNSFATFQARTPHAHVYRAFNSLG
ncbi:MAG TPA: NAD(P)-binding domain-containing protein, partial [Ktedonobacteraceae bacterium]|nr:NAD(P)-binding domain-containing protein [Ktedonobacteraceae bacterium]